MNTSTIFTSNKKAKLVGALMLLGMITGILSVAPNIDATDYLTRAATAPRQIIIAAVFQFLLAMIYVGIALALFPILYKVQKSWATGFLSFRIITASLMIPGTLLLLCILVLSQEFMVTPDADSATLSVIGNMLKYGRDCLNHIFMVSVLGTSNLLLYALFFKSRLVPKWLSIWGLIGTALSILASLLLLFQVVEVITPEYLVLNLPTAVLEMVLGGWLVVKGFGS